MNKKGLTLVQFAGAVIVLGLVLILLWPHYEKVVTKSRYNTFVTASIQLLNYTGTAYVKNPHNHYSNVTDSYPNLASEKKGYQYIIEVDQSGHPISFKITNGKYKVEGEDEKGIKVDAIGEGYKVETCDSGKFVLLENGTFQEEK